jgi:hypothetical protein
MLAVQQRHRISQQKAKQATGTGRAQDKKQQIQQTVSQRRSATRGCHPTPEEIQGPGLGDAKSPWAKRSRQEKQAECREAHQTVDKVLRSAETPDDACSIFRPLEIVLDENVRTG